MGQRTYALARIALFAIGLAAALPAQSAEPPLPADTFAVVGRTTLSAAEFQRAFTTRARDKFYHAKPPEAEIAQYQREVGDELVNRVLVVDEARRRNIKPDPEFVKQQLAKYEARAKHAPNWEKDRAKFVEAVTNQFENQSRYEQLEQQVRKVAPPTEAQARAFYDANKALFVEPEQVRLSVILLKVDPSAPKSAWEQARAEAAALRKRVVAGEDFAMLARRHSKDDSAKDGGDMGYLHRGMLPEGVDRVADGLKPGQLSEPVTLLEGVAVFRLHDRKAAQQRTFNEVQTRAGELWQREESDKRWAGLIAGLRKATPVRINEALYLPLAKPAAAKAG